MLHLEIYVTKCLICGGKYAIYSMQKWDKTVKKVGQQGYDVKNRDCPSYIGTVDTFAKSDCVLFLLTLNLKVNPLTITAWQTISNTVVSATVSIHSLVYY